MTIRAILVFCVLLYALQSKAQRVKEYIHPEYKIRQQDTIGTFIEIINYYDRTFYSTDIFLRKLQNDGSSAYYQIKIDAKTGMGIIPVNIPLPIHLLIQNTLEIENLALGKNQIHRIDIRNEDGFLSMPLVGKNAAKDVRAKLIDVYNNDTSTITLPLNKILPKGKYELVLNMLPQYKRTIYAKPAMINYNEVIAPVPFVINNNGTFAEYELQYSTYPSRKYIVCSSGALGESPVRLDLQPNKMYRLLYKKKGKKRYRRKRFFIGPDMETFIVTF